jgi:hypothetical protein
MLTAHNTGRGYAGQAPESVYLASDNLHALFLSILLWAVPTPITAFEYRADSSRQHNGVGSSQTELAVVKSFSIGPSREAAKLINTKATLGNGK